ncbi:olfactory receptor 10A7-like [Engystomops pustulosus]|uniref:olfactory receptor 10A7-like n=1 Tax=Engystomops pustulosus TaxID=76066 RepID=UPI003AFAC870
MCGNLLIIVVVSSSRSLHSPMYFFLTQLSVSDILLTTTIVPNMLHTLLCDGSSMSLVGCLIQYHFFVASEVLETLLLTVMSYDRYQAICNPLHYYMVMNPTCCLWLLALVWLVIFVVILVTSVTMSHLQFCGPNIIDHFFCDRDPILELSCSDTFIIETESLIFMIPLAIFPSIIILISYIYIIITIMKIHSNTGKQKTFSTCSSHLAVVFIYYGSTMSIYLFPRKITAKKIPSLLYIVVTPLLNPIIYSLANRDIIDAFRNLLSKMSSNNRSLEQVDPALGILEPSR